MKSQIKKSTEAQIKGRMGEEAALHYLIKNGYKEVTRNYHSKYGEIDLIVKNAEYIVFAEVKERSIKAVERPSAWVDSRKRKKLIKTAVCYLTENYTELQPRFDVIEVIYNGNELYVDHMENAFDVDYEYYEY